MVVALFVGTGSFIAFLNLRLTLRTISFNIHKFCVLPTQCIYVFCVDLRKNNSDYFSLQL